MNGRLFIVGTPIGNSGDISLRALGILRSVEAVACEEQREGARLLRAHGISKSLVEINEHTERENIPRVLALLREGGDVALISDAGMPAVEDPGRNLVRAARRAGFDVTAVPGPTAVATALALSGMDTSRYQYYGLLSPKADMRRRELRAFLRVPHPVVLLDAPYRLLPVLEDMLRVLGPDRIVCVACDLTMEREEIRIGPLREIVSHCRAHPKKCEFVIVLERAGG